MKEITHIVPVGHTKETLVESLRRFPVSKIVLVLGDKPEIESEKIARGIAEKVKAEMGSVPCEEIYVDLDDVLSIALVLVRRIRAEVKSGCGVKLNLSGSLRSVDIAGYAAALMTSTPVYIGIPAYERNRIVGIKGIQTMPLIPIKEFFSEKKEIIQLLGSVGGIYLEDIIKKLRPDLNSEDYDKERSRLSYHIKDLKKEGFVETEKDGRKLKVRLSGVGRIYVEGLEVTL